MTYRDPAEELEIRAGSATLPGILSIPPDPKGIVLFAHGSGSSRLSPRNASVARMLEDAGFGTLRFDLLTEEEDLVPGNRFEIGWIAERLTDATRWLSERPEARKLRFGYFGASTGAAAALRASVAPGTRIRAVVSRGGRPDLAGDALERVTAPTLLIVGGRDEFVIRLNREAFARLGCRKRLEIVPGATHLFVEPGALEAVGVLAAEWFRRHLT